MMHASQGPFNPDDPGWNPPTGKGKPIVENDPNGIPQNSPGAKLDAGKNMGWLFFSGFSRALEDVSRVTTVGATKYTKNGWVDVPDGINRYMDAFARHAFEHGKGKVYDDGPNGTGCTHISQMIWNLLAAHELALRKQENESTSK